MAYQFAREPLTTDEADALVKACRTPNEKLVIWTLLDTGLRVSEVSSISKDSIDFQTHRITIYGKAKGERKKRRVLKLSPRLKELLEPHIISQDHFNMSIQKIQRTVKRVASRAKIRRKTSPHVLRHTFAVQALQRGVSLPALMHWLGHTDLKTTAIYLNLAPEEAIKEMESKW